MTKTNVAIIILLLIIAVIAISPYVLFLEMVKHSKKYSCTHIPREKLSNVYFTLKTGDIILFTSASNLPGSATITKTFFTHIGVILRDGEHVYMSEAQSGLELMPDPNNPDVDIRMSPGVALTPFLTRTKHYNGGVYAMQLARPLDSESAERITTAAESLYIERYPYPSISQIMLGVTGVGWSGARHCFQHTAYLLSLAGLFKPDFDAFNVCSEICELSEKPLPREDNYYLQPVEILYDI